MPTAVPIAARLGLFFITVGAGMDLTVLISAPWTIAVICADAFDGDAAA